MLMMAIAIVATIVSYYTGNVVDIPGDTGTWLPSADDWLPAGGTSLVINLILNVLIAAMLILLNKRFNILRSPSDLFAGLFLILQMSLPSFMGQFYGGTLLCFAVLFLTYKLYMAFNRPYPLQPIFLIFFLLTVGAMSQYAYLFYIPVFMIGCAQMRIFSFKTLLAIGIGIIAPVWILWGFDLISLRDIKLPHFVNVFSAIDSKEMLQLLVTVGVTVMATFVFGILNLVRVFNYNSKTRAYNGFISIMSFVTIILVLADYTNSATYIPLLNCCAAFQMGHYFAINNYQRSYIAILGIIAVYIALYWWSVMV
jgi:hypothetical protein